MNIKQGLLEFYYGFASTLVGISGSHGSGAAILCYHRLTPQAEPGFLTRQISVTLPSFSEQLKWLKANYAVVSLDALVDDIAAGEIIDGKVAITFDDGYRDNAYELVRIVEDLRVPVTIFVTAGFISRQYTLWWFCLDQAVTAGSMDRVARVARGELGLARDSRSRPDEATVLRFLRELFMQHPPDKHDDILRGLGLDPVASKEKFQEKMMTWADLKSISLHPLITIGAHTLSHPRLSVLDRSSVDTEILHSKEIIENNLLVKVNHFAYPYGKFSDINEGVVSSVRNAGYKSAVTTIYGMLDSDSNRKIYTLPRIPISGNDSLKTVRAKMSRLNSIIHSIRDNIRSEA